MKFSSLLSGIVLLTFAVTADAHAHLLRSIPADNSVVAASPASLVLNFSEAAQLTALSIQKGHDPEHKLKLLPGGAAAQISVPLPPLTPGAYTVSWRVLSADGHVVSGALRFTLSADPATGPTG